VGPVHVGIKHQETIPIPPWAAGAGLALGVVLVFAARK